jgi:hypothetical protein
MSDKLDKVLKLLEEVADIFPEMDKVIFNDPINPDYIIIATEEFINNMSEGLDLDDIEDIADEYPSIPAKKKKKTTIQ